MPLSPTEEIRAIRHELAAQFGTDLDRIVADLRRQQQESGREYVTLPKHQPYHPRMRNHALHGSGVGDVPANDESTPAAR